MKDLDFKIEFYNIFKMITFFYANLHKYRKHIRFTFLPRISEKKKYSHYLIEGFPFNVWDAETWFQYGRIINAISPSGSVSNALIDRPEVNKLQRHSSVRASLDQIRLSPDSRA